MNHPGFVTVVVVLFTRAPSASSMCRLRYQTRTDPETGEAYGFATNSGATKYLWGIARFEEEIEHRTSDENPANTSVTGRYALTEELEDRTVRFEQDVSFTSDEENFYLKFDRRVLVDGELYGENQWHEAIERDFQ